MDSVFLISTTNVRISRPGHYYSKYYIWNKKQLDDLAKRKKKEKALFMLEMSVSLKKNMQSIQHLAWQKLAFSLSHISIFNRNFIF